MKTGAGPRSGWGLALALAAVRLGAAQDLPAFPGAEGYGALAVGGRGGDVYVVTTLADGGPGSLRDAVGAGHRTVVFRVSGTIDLQADLVISQSDLTIAGQTAPGDGICLKRHSLRVYRAHDVVIRFLRVRPGDEFGRPLDGIEIRESRDVILDHCSVSWWEDEGINTWHGASRVTVQWCLIAEGLNRSSNYGPHAFGASWGGEDCSYHHNLFAHCTARNPSVAGTNREPTIDFDHRCSVIYNWEHRTCDGKPVSANVVNNYYKPGPATRPDVRHRIVRLDDSEAGYHFQSGWYIDGNEVEGFPAISADNWRGGVEFEGRTSEAVNRRRMPWPFAPVTTQPAAQAYGLVLDHVGANRPRRDAEDARILREVRTGTATFGNGIIDSQRQVGGWPELRSAPALRDADGDGMPDAWELAHGLNPHDPADRNRVAADGYTELEHYLSELAAE